MTELCMGYDAEYRYVEALQQIWQIAQTRAPADALRARGGHLAADTEPRAVLLSDGPGAAAHAQPGHSRSRHRRQMAAQEAQEGPLRDRTIAAAQLKVEHVEVAGYTGLVTGTQQMG
jgi:hypothetical protein